MCAILCIGNDNLLRGYDMKQYCVQRIEVYRQDILIDAETPHHAINLVAEGEGIENELHYERTLDPDEWNVHEIK